MKLIELQKFGDYSLVLRANENGNPLIIEPYVVACKPYIKDNEVVDWAYGHYFDDIFNAVNYARTREGKINHYRLEEIASKAIDGLIEDDEETAYEYFASEIEMDDHEAEYFGLDVEKLNEHK